MNTTEISELHQKYVMPTYAPGLALVRGAGTSVWDAEGNEYLDFSAGLAVANVGHCHPRLSEAIATQARRLMHVSNLYYNELQPQLAQAISERSLGGKIFFCNSGAEANEGLIKLARRWGHEQGRHEIITVEKSFHGRTLATLTATGQDKVKTGFDPLPPGFVTIPFNDLDAVRRAVNERTAGVLVESIQGEGGVRPTDPDYLTGLRTLCDELDILMLCDEVQCGMGRTGDWFGYQGYDVSPDAISMAKGMGGGFPIGGIAAVPALSDVLVAGTHATTFGGTPLACAAGLAVIHIIEEEGLLENALQMGDRLEEGLQPLVDRIEWVEDIRGPGLMKGLVLNQPAGDLAAALQKKGLLVIATANTVIRLVPPLTVSAEEIDRAVALITEEIDR